MKNIIILITLILSAITSTFASELNVNEIMKKAHLVSYYQGDDGSAQLLMKVYLKGKSRPIKKLFYMLRKDIEDGGEQLFFTYFVKPSDIKNTTFLVHKKIVGDDYRRLYIPASDKVLAISGARKQDPFMGSDFSYEDVSGRHFSKDTHRLIRSDKIGNDIVYVTESIPKDSNDKNSKIIAWIRKKDFVPLKVEYFNKKNKLYRIYSSSNIKVINGFPTILKRTMTSPIEETKSIILLNPKKVKYNIGFPDSLFTERNLKKPVMKYFK